MIKKIRFSRIDPPTTFSNDEISINIAGMRYQRGFAITRHQWIRFCHEMQQKEVITTTVYHSSKHYKKSTVFQNDIWPDWEDHINNSNNVVRFVHNGKKMS